MKLIEAEKAKDVIHEYFKSLMINGASGTDVDRLAVGIGSCLKHDANLLKAIDELPSAEPDTTTHDSIPAETGGNYGDRTSGDCISRQQAINKIKPWLEVKGYSWGELNMLRAVINELENMPSAQPETNCSEIPNNSDTISRQAAIDKFIDDLEEIFSDIRERHVDDSVCGLCEYDGAYIGQSGDWCNECPGFDRDDCFKLSDKTRKKWTDEIIKALPSIQPERKMGKWIYGESEVGNDGYYCSECGNFVPWIYEESAMNFIREYKFCPNCGAKMKGERKE